MTYSVVSAHIGEIECMLTFKITHFTSPEQPLSNELFLWADTHSQDIL